MAVNVNIVIYGTVFMSFDKEMTANSGILLIEGPMSPTNQFYYALGTDVALTILGVGIYRAAATAMAS